ncbi:MAG: UDP-N-acetylmuramoyl-L-alanyl-D-glutamate--2,6-diaminopimelate ligase [Candidatus Melainabacteria bacterium]|nr:UDP-N-acetylmuramoyl-L-alanyl-D-glutamate--2,6-diaminopimelate ligase [Candidatus Melainabacteria bacterium]
MTSKTMTIKDLASYLGYKLNINENPTITGISYDSRAINKGDIFVCLIGEKTDGHKHIKEAEEKGASAILAQNKIESKLPVIYTKDTQIGIAKLANYFFHEPSKQLRIIGVTGTNGKTTTTHLIQHILEKHNLKTALIGTLGTKEKSSDKYYDAKHTTPQAPDLQKSLYDLIQKGFTHLAMEVSSHALSLNRVDDCHFAGAVITNITQDHLDFHLTMNEYTKAKKKLFEMLNSSVHKNKFVILNQDDISFNEFKKIVGKEIKIFSYGIKNKADFQAQEINFTAEGLNFTLMSPEGKFKAKSKLNGQFNVYNLLASICSAYAEGVNLSNIIQYIEDAKEVAGRFQIIKNEAKEYSPICIVDYAHTPDGLENILKAARFMVKHGKKLICVFGCGGDRDPTKRPKMGKIAEELSDLVIVTSDNPRTEEPNQIINDILSGIQNTSSIIVEPDRKSAIEIAVNKAEDNDIIVLAGKGHEDYQILKDKTIHFDDREEIAKALTNVSLRAPSGAKQSRSIQP